jgi:hypothetical protein
MSFNQMGAQDPPILLDTARAPQVTRNLKPHKRGPVTSRPGAVSGYVGGQLRSFNRPRVLREKKGGVMKKIFGIIMSIVLLAGAALPAAAQTRSRYVPRAAQQRIYERDRRVYYDRRDDRSFVDEHRDKLTLAGGTAAGAVIGALAGGGKGAIIGALIGAGGSALYTYGIRDKNDEGRWRR